MELDVGEGLESSLAAMQEGQGQTPMWAALSTTGLAALVLPPTVLKVTIYADSDPPGIAAARKAARRWRAEGRVVDILRPKDSGKDFNDLLLEEHRA